MVYITKSAGESYPITGNTVSLSSKDLGQGGQKSNELGRKYRESSTERLFSSVPFGSFRGVSLGAVWTWAANDVTMHEWRGGGATQLVQFNHNTSLGPRLLSRFGPCSAPVGVLGVKRHRLASVNHGPYLSCPVS